MKASPAPQAVFATLSRALGGAVATRTVQSITAIASCSGPYGPYETEVVSMRGERLLFTQRRPERAPFCALMRGNRAWAYDPAGGLGDELDPIVVAMVRSHDFQMLPLVMAQRYRDLAAGWQQRFAGAECNVVAMTDELGYPCQAYFRCADGLWAGMTLVDARDPGNASVRVVVRAWRQIGAVRLPSALTASDAAGDFQLDFHTITLNTVDPAIFTLPANLAAA